MAPRQAGALLLVLLTACASTNRFAPRGPPPDYTPNTRWYEVDVVEPGTVSTRPVPVGKAEFQRALQALARDIRLTAPPQEAARELLKARLELEEEWLAEVYRDRILTLVPVDEKASLTSEEEAALRTSYLRWCEKRGGGDCQGLLTDGPYLRTDDRRTLALALAFGSVLDETREALVRELLDPRAVIATLVWTVGLYLMLWVAPEPAVTKGLAAVLTVLLVGWLGVDTVWGLVDGWAQLAHHAHEARTFEELRTAGDQYAKVIGTDAARTLILAVASLTGRTLGDVATRVRSLPGYGVAAAQWESQGLQMPMAAAVGTVETVVASHEGALAVLTSPQGVLAGAMLSHNASGEAIPPPQGPSVTTVIRHRGGNQQVMLDNGQRWHLPRGKSPRDIPTEDPLGDELQAAANRIAKQWGQHELSPSEQRAIEKALAQGKHHRALQLEGQARGRWVEAQLREEFKHLKWNRQGVDVTGPPGQEHHYEVLAGTADNFGLHGRRMSDAFFRMISF